MPLGPAKGPDHPIWHAATGTPLLAHRYWHTCRGQPEHDDVGSPEPLGSDNESLTAVDAIVE